MKYLLKPILLFSLLFSSAQAVEIDFESTGLTNLSSTFQGADILSNTQNLTTSNFGINVTFSGGVLLENPVVGSSSNPINCPTCGNVFYGSALSQSTGVITDDFLRDSNGNAVDEDGNLVAVGNEVFRYLTPTISIDIDPSEQITKVSGSLLSGLNTSLIDAMNPPTTDYLVSFLSQDGSFFDNQLVITAGYNSAEFVPEAFEFDTSSLAGTLMNSIITGLRITAVGIDFPGMNDILPSLSSPMETEWDFLIDSVCI